MKPAQVRMARAALRWTLEDASRLANVHRNTISNIENEKYKGDEDSHNKLREAFEKYGAVFVDNEAGLSGVLVKVEATTKTNGGGNDDKDIRLSRSRG